MAPTSSQKRQRADDSLSDQRSSKKPKSTSTGDKPANFPPKFYDNLSKIWLTPRALRELNRRNKERPPSKSKSKSKPTTGFVKPRGAKLAALAKLGVPELALFAAAGGPDLSDLKGYPEPMSTAHMMESPSVPSNPDGASILSSSSRPTGITSATTRSKRTSAYDANFRQNCIDYRIYPPLPKLPDGTLSPKPANLEEILKAVEQLRGSLSPSVVPETAYDDFVLTTEINSEKKYMRIAFPLIAGDADIFSEDGFPFVNLTSLTENTTSNPNPDLFDGAYPSTVDRQVRKDLNSIIIPTRDGSNPIAPNFFLEAKGPLGTTKVAESQAMLDGAHGAHMMHTLQNYLTDGEPLYDGNAYAFSVTLADGIIRLFAHHMTAPIKPGGLPGYHTTLITVYGLLSRKLYSEGRSAFRNLRMRAKEDRDRFIKIANARARLRYGGDGVAVGSEIFDTIETEEQVEAANQIEREEQVGGVDQVEAGDQVERGDQVEAGDQIEAGNQVEREDQVEIGDQVGGEDRDEGSSPLDFYDANSVVESEDDEQETQQTLVSNAGLGIFHHDTESFASSFTSASREDCRRPRQIKKPRSPPSPSSTRKNKRRGQAEPAG